MVALKLRQVAALLDKGCDLKIIADSAVSARAIVEFGRVCAQRFPVDTQLRVLPKHSCATGAQFPEYQALTGDTVSATWQRFYGS